MPKDHTNISPTTQLKRLVNQRAHAFSIAEFSRIRNAIDDALAGYQNRKGLSLEELINWFKTLDDAKVKEVAGL